jgi:hypothetical protein
VALVDLVDETYVVAAPDAVAAAVHDRARWRDWWPDLELTVFMDRGLAGIRWSATGPLVGSSELWLEPVGDGVLVHYYLRVDPGGALRPGRSPDRWADRIRRRHALAWKRSVNALKDELEVGRRPGEPRVAAAPTSGSSRRPGLPTTGR